MGQAPPCLTPVFSFSHTHSIQVMGEGAEKKAQVEGQEAWVLGPTLPLLKRTYGEEPGPS